MHKKILHVIGGMNTGGAETLVMNVFRNINREQYQFDFAVGTKKKCHYDDEIKELGGRIFNLSNGRRDFKNYLIQLQSVIKNNDYDVVHCHLYEFSAVALVLSKFNKVPIRIAHSHTTRDIKNHSILRILYQYSMKTVLKRNATKLLGCSSKACESLYGVKCWNDKRTDVLKNTIDLTPYERLNENQKKIDAKNQKVFFGRGPVIGHVGRFNKVKNHTFLINVFQQLVKDVPDAQLVLIGDGPLRSEMEGLVESKGIQSNVHFLGVRSDIPNLMSMMDVFFLPSLYEGLGIVLIEAQASGVPCLISDTVPRDADMGLELINWISLNEGVDKWAEQLKSIIFHQKKKDREKCIKQIKQNGYSIDSTVKSLVDIYNGR